jgi:hypothetical protein
MAIQLEFLNLIIPIKQINLCYPGGFELFREHHKDKFGQNLWHDMHLFRDGAMTSMEVESLVSYWQHKGLVPYVEQNGKKKWKDMFVIDATKAEPAFPCDWIEVDQENNCVFHRKRSKGRIIGREEMRLYYG